jgi:CRP/FNR family transcriptional regulator, cyclic AMP receptor protein
MALFDKWFDSRRDGAFPSSRPASARQAGVAQSTSAREAARLLRAPTALMQLSEEESLTVVSFMRPLLLSAGTVIIQQGEASDTDFMILVLEGEITVESLIGRKVNAATVTVLGPGSVVGEMALVDGAARSATCTASTDVRCAVLTRGALEALIAEQPATAAKFMIAVAKRLAERLRDCSHKLQIHSKLVQTLQQEIDILLPTPGGRR